MSSAATMPPPDAEIIYGTWEYAPWSDFDRPLWARSRRRVMAEWREGGQIMRYWDWQYA